MGLYSDGASRPSFAHPREIARRGPRVAPPPDPRISGGQPPCLSVSPRASLRLRGPRARDVVERGVRVRRHATHAGRVLDRGGWDWEAEQAKRPTDPAPSLPRRRALHGRKRLRARGRKRERPLLRFLQLLVAALRLRLLVLGALLLVMGDRQGTWNGPAARPSWRGTRPAKAADARARAHTQFGEHIGRPAGSSRRR